MIRLKGKEEIIYSNYQICLVADCDEEATDLYTTETMIIDVCKDHRLALLAQSFIS